MWGAWSITLFEWKKSNLLTFTIKYTTFMVISWRRLQKEDGASCFMAGGWISMPKIAPWADLQLWLINSSQELKKNWRRQKFYNSWTKFVFSKTLRIILQKIVTGDLVYKIKGARWVPWMLTKEQTKTQGSCIDFPQSVRQRWWWVFVPHCY